MIPFEPDPKLDLVLERVVDVPPDLVWTAWTKPEHLKKWLTPAPWTTTDCEIDLRPVVELEHRLQGHGEAEQMRRIFDGPTAWEGTIRAENSGVISVRHNPPA